MALTFDHGISRIRDFGIHSRRDAKTGKIEIQTIEVAGEQVVPSKRFWKSFFQRFGVSDSIFRYFEPTEVFQRISERAADDLVRYSIERCDEDEPRMLAVSSPNRPLISYASVRRLINRFGGTNVEYEEGQITSTHQPRSGEHTFEVGGDTFRHHFVMETPIDGFSHPKIYLSFLRLICANGMVGYSRAFRSDVSLGKDIGHCISRALETYDNGEGYAALRQRFESSQTSWASVRECHELYKTLHKVEARDGLRNQNVFKDLGRLTGNLHELYGFANLEALSAKRQRILPAKCRVYDLINFAGEVGTHHSNPNGNRRLQSYIGSLISDEYDMEGTANAAAEFEDLFVTAVGTAN